jgi:hypothetical protein
MRSILVTSLLVCSLAHADAKPAGKPDDAKMKQMMEAAEKAHAPGPQHQWLKTNLAGSWTIESKSFGPNGETMTASGTAEAKAVHGDRFIAEEFSQMRMGKPMTGSLWFGYDNMRKKFTGAESDSVGTGMTFLSGDLDNAKKTLTLTGMTWSMMLNKEVQMRVVMKVESDKKHTIEIFSPGPDGKEAKRVEIAYTRK